MSNEPLSGAEFQREVRDEPGKWAQCFLAAYATAEGVHSDADRLAFVTFWFRDAMEAAVKAHAPRLSDIVPE